MVHGENVSVAISRMPPAYHTKPHVHNREQIYRLLSGEMWYFVHTKGYRLKPGDFVRIPAGSICWAWNRGDKEAEAISVNVPGRHSNPDYKGSAIPLFDDEPALVLAALPQTLYLDADYYNAAAIEAAAIDAERQRQAGAG
jgi:uncharacterized RmlC-like cupin family protein